MAEIPVTINGVIYPKGKSADDKPVPCVIVGKAWVTGLEIGGGPVYPPDQPPPVDPPIEEPPPDLAPNVTMVAKPPPPEGGWGWFPEYGWLYYPKDAAQPKQK